MITRIRIPQAFENMEEATIGKWLKREGDLLRNGEPLCELITEKTTFDLPVEHLAQPEYLRRIVAPEKSIVPVGYIIAIAGDYHDELPDVDLENEALLQIKATDVREAIVAEPVATSIAPPRTDSSAGTRLRATPAARRVAKERGIDLEELSQKLGGKVITEEDVLNS